MFNIFLVVLLLSVCYEKVSAATLAPEGKSIGVVGKNLTLTWSYTGTKEPQGLTILISPNGSSEYLKIWNVKFDKGMSSVYKIAIPPSSSVYFFNNITRLEIKTVAGARGKYRFNLHIKRVPRNIASYAFVCKVEEGIWNMYQKIITVKLAGKDILYFLVLSQMTFN